MKWIGRAELLTLRDLLGDWLARTAPVIACAAIVGGWIAGYLTATGVSPTAILAGALFGLALSLSATLAGFGLFLLLGRARE